MSLRMQLRIGPAQLLLAELLPLAAAGLGERVETELQANPALELPEPAACPGCGHAAWRGICVGCAGLGCSASRADDADQQPRREAVLCDALAAIAPTDRPVAAHLVGDVDEHGVLDVPLADIARRLSIDVAAVQRVVTALRSAGWPGLCAPSLAESLQRQAAAAVAAEPTPPEVRVLVTAGLGSLLTGPPTALTAERLHAALAWLRPRLSVDLFAAAERPARPLVDVVVRRRGQQLGAAVVGGPWSAVRLAESYRAAAIDPRVRPDVARAERFVTALGRREQTLARVADLVIARQEAQVHRGSAAHRPLTRREIAAELGLHESTVSRAVAGKQVGLPSGRPVPLASFFGPADDVLRSLRSLVDSEVEPLSDTALTALLVVQGHVVTRRTVAKYRAVLGIPDRRRRRPGALLRSG